MMAGAVLLSGQALAHEAVPTAPAQDEVSTPAATQADQAMPVRLSAAELDRVTAGALGLPNAMVIFSGFDNPAPGVEHPNFGRSETGFAASENHGPWSAAFNSPVIEFSFE